jgi:preprotein translocase subunit SecD
MLAADQGDLAWQVTRAEAVKDSAGNPAMFIELDEAGGRRLGELTESHMHQPLAILIKNRVAMVATIVSTMTNHVQITGQFEQETVDWWVESLNPPVPAAAE